MQGHCRWRQVASDRVRSGMGDVGVPGLENVAGLANWLAGNDLPGGGADLAVELIAGGRSNLTYRVEFPAPGGAAPAAGAATRMVLRRPPLGHVLPTAHDMAREYRVLSALSGTSIPVPTPVAFCSDTEVTGASFYVMRYVTGRVLRTREHGAQLSQEQARRLSEFVVDMLAAIHGVNIEAVGLVGFGRPEGYMTRQLARWQR